jgi:hypothetical protein
MAAGPEPWIEFAKTNQPLRRFRRVTRPRKRDRYASACQILWDPTW